MYVTRQGMVDRYGQDRLVQLTDIHDPPTGGIVDAVLDLALADAANVIHGYARAGGYQVPFSPAPDMVVRWQADIALYLLHRDGAPEKVAEDYKAAIGQLKDLARGVVALQAAGVAAPVADGGGTVLLDGAGRTFTGGSLRGF